MVSSFTPYCLSLYIAHHRPPHFVPFSSYRVYFNVISFSFLSDLVLWLAVMASQVNPIQKAGPGSTAPGPSVPFVNGLNAPFVPDGLRPDRGSGVTFQADPSVSVGAYIDAMTDALASADVHSASRISHGRVAVYFGSRQAALHAVQEGFSYKGSYLELTPLGPISRNATTRRSTRYDA